MENFNAENLVFMETGHTVMENELPVAKLFLIICVTTCVKSDKWILCNLESFDKIWNFNKVHPVTCNEGTEGK